MYLNRGGFNLRRQRRDRLMYVAVYIVLIFAGLYLNSLIGVDKTILPPGVPTATATRSPQSFSEEAEKQFSAGRLNEAITAYQRAIQLEPKRADYWIKLARIQVYAQKPEDAVKSAETAILLDPNNSTAHAVHALALDWTGDYASASDAAVRAINLDPNNALAYAYYAEVLVDQQRWSQARDAATQALNLDPNSLDAYRTYGYFLEATGNYAEAIEQYQAALKINPNLGFIYMRIGANYRTLAGRAATSEEQQRYFDLAIQYFQRASAINPNDIEPYRSISRTYFQIGQYGAAAQYLEVALEIDPLNALLHGDLGKIYFKALNYESAIIELRCAVDGCTTAEDTIDDEDGAPVFDIQPLALSSATLETYYIYTSVLAALSTAEAPHCNRARPLMAQISVWLEQNPGNEFVFDILAESERICQLADANANAAAPTPASAATAAALAPAGTPTP